jgi:hypothetical protein
VVSVAVLKKGCFSGLVEIEARERRRHEEGAEKIFDGFSALHILGFLV